ncbi:TnsA endonuclease N-terminal domain-containing protein [Bacillus albus]|uniref:TnsA endonuclease N-terminal domain-containing protein n=1 Tax=Bacillus cereus group TaxID=86661 RepID=UPI002DB897D6|nr:TnsA endonuclease N-terminal domain-containing protein [Bacillus tropicus]MEC3471078.1 TnsA endonuclease N-terminal domain-containing protein [Bacillus tropicus]
MAKRNNEWTERKIEKYIKEGRGQGELSNYKPWLTIQNVSSRGNSNRLKGWKTNRGHEFLSDLEEKYFFTQEWRKEVIDIREQFPLNRELTQKISEEKGINHPICTNTQTLVVLTTDFFLTIRSGEKIKYIARTVKPSNELEDRRTIEKFEVEREYWARKGISWGIVTEKDIPIELSENISWVYEHYYLEDIKNETLVKVFLKYLMNFQQADKNLISLCNEFDEKFNLDVGSSINFFKHLVARKVISVDMREKKLNPNSLCVQEITFNQGEGDNCDYAIS